MKEEEKPPIIDLEEQKKEELVTPEVEEARKRGLLEEDYSIEDQLDKINRLAREKLPWYNVATKESIDEARRGGKTIEAELRGLNRLAKEKFKVPEKSKETEKKIKKEPSSSKEEEKRLENSQLWKELIDKLDEAWVRTKDNYPNARAELKQLYEKEIQPKSRNITNQFGLYSEEFTKFVTEYIQKLEKYIAEHSK